MPTHKLKTAETTEWAIGPGGTWMVTERGSVVVDGTAGIRIVGDKTHLIVDGFVSTTGGGAIVDEGRDSLIEIGENGVIGGLGQTISMEGDSPTLINHGRVYGSISGTANATHLENYGYVSDMIELHIGSGTSGTIINHDDGVLRFGIFVVGSAGSRSRIVNNGAILADAGSVVLNGTDGNDTMISTHDLAGGIMPGNGNNTVIVRNIAIAGKIETGDGNDRVDIRGGTITKGGNDTTYDINLGFGDDRIDLRGATVSGSVYGSDGDDTYIVDSKIRLVEVSDYGDDQVIAYSSFKLPDNIEDLILKGSKNIDARGNAGSNLLTGNSGNNLLRGLGGLDGLDGRGGNDRLVGGAGADFFAFATGYDKDTIVDFKHGEDKIYVNAWKNVDKFADVKSHASNHGDDVWITVGKDTLVIENLHKADLHASDFHF